MDDATDGVTLYSGFVFDLLAEYEAIERICAPIFAMVKGLDRARPLEPCPITLYNDICTWIEKNIGTASIREAGRAIGVRVFNQMISEGRLGHAPTPVRLLEELSRIAGIMIQDPRGRGWDILESSETSARVRRTQTFNCILQEGLLLSLVDRASVTRTRVDHITCTRSSAPYCEYVVTWHARPARERFDTPLGIPVRTLQTEEEDTSTGIRRNDGVIVPLRARKKR